MNMWVMSACRRPHVGWQPIATSSSPTIAAPADSSRWAPITDEARRAQLCFRFVCCQRSWHSRRHALGLCEILSTWLPTLRECMCFGPRLVAGCRQMTVRSSERPRGGIRNLELQNTNCHNQLQRRVRGTLGRREETREHLQGTAVNSEKWSFWVCQNTFSTKARQMSSCEQSPTF